MTAGDDAEESADAHPPRHIHETWRRAFHSGVQKGLVTPVLVAKVMDLSPLAAAYVLEALSDTPCVQDARQNPLPARARVGQGFANTVNCAYEDDHE
eukprot:13813602-Heterocapsa_arctica.AAC.1